MRHTLQTHMRMQLHLAAWLNHSNQTQSDHFRPGQEKPSRSLYQLTTNITLLSNTKLNHKSHVSWED